MNKGTIIYVGGFEMPDKNAAAHRVLNNGKALRALGYRVVYLGISHTNTELTKEEFFGMDSWSIPYPQGTLKWLRYLSSIQALTTVAEKYEDVKAVIFYNYQAKALSKGIRLCKKKGWLSIADVTEWYQPTKKNLIFYAIKRWDTQKRMKKLHLKMDGVISISKYLQDYYESRNCLSIQVPPLVDKQEEKWAQDIVSVPNILNIVYAGNSGDMKDCVELLVDAAKEFVGKLELHIVGNVIVDGKQCTSEDSIDNIRYYGRLPHEKCIKIIQNSHFQVFFRQDNLVTRAGFPTKLGESFACGAAVITNTHSNVAEYLNDGVNALVVTEVTKESIYNVLRRATELSFEDIQSMKETCLKDMRFDFRMHVAAFGSFFQEVANKKGRDI